MTGLPRYIAIEGPIGVGKTTLTQKIAERINARVVLEEFSDNPFLRDFYQDKDRVAFQTQVYFLVARFKQQEELRQHDLFARSIVSDYLFAKDRIFAYLNLAEAELQLYERIYDLLRPRLVKPDLVVYLQARPDVLMKRLRKRGREMEASVEVQYLDSLQRAYNQFFFHYDESPLLIVETSDIDVRLDEDFDLLIDAMRRATHGTNHFVPRSRAG
ncbi:MAG: deoxynucleoside kinase [Myxococcota bacterium]